MLKRVQALFAGLSALAVCCSTYGAPADSAPEANRCSSPSEPLALGSAQWNGWGRDIENTRYQPEPAIRATDVPKLGLKWSFGVGGGGVAGQPTVVDGRLFVQSAAGRVYSLDARTGCTYWTYDAEAGSHSAIFIGELAPSRRAAEPVPERRPRSRSKSRGRHARHQLTLAHLDVLKAPSAAFFGDDAGAVYALDAQKGTLLWKTQVDSHPLARISAAPVLFHDRLYVVVNSGEQSAAQSSAYACCTFRGSIAALDMLSGHIVWKTYTVPEEPKAGAGGAIASTPAVDAKRGLLYVGTGAALTPVGQTQTDAILAVDLRDGQVRWAKQFSRHDQTGAAEFVSAPILRTLADGRQVVLAGQKSGIVYALDPERSGELLWQTKPSEVGIPRGIEWGPAADHRSLYVALSGLAAEPENPSGAMEAIDMKTGSRRWYTAAPAPACAWRAEACAHAGAQAVTVIPGAAFSGSMDGHIRAYSTIDGKILWDADTAKEYLTINGVKASGGSLDQGGATIVNGVLYINSGYGQRNGQPGNVLLAFSVDGR